ncbi:hypothetical protein PR048_025505 [Dryococelus australis]|uniref:Uncharacterized protein n=1 Tax=Dryococelus australis TaxID=614101 RepID=A0ABQ9GRH3_9NEOP|nr:hypothetical protein PR048_025505 [Dryococelus australis]
MKGRGKREIPEKTRRPPVSSGVTGEFHPQVGKDGPPRDRDGKRTHSGGKIRLLHRHDSRMRKSRVSQPGIEPGSPWCLASMESYEIFYSNGVNMESYEIFYSHGANMESYEIFYSNGANMESYEIFYSNGANMESYEIFYSNGANMESYEIFYSNGANMESYEIFYSNGANMESYEIFYSNGVNMESYEIFYSNGANMESYEIFYSNGANMESYEIFYSNGVNMESYEIFYSNGVTRIHNDNSQYNATYDIDHCSLCYALAPQGCEKVDNERSTDQNLKREQENPLVEAEKDSNPKNRKDDGALDAHDSIAFVAIALFGLKRGRKLQAEAGFGEADCGSCDPSPTSYEACSYGVSHSVNTVSDGGLPAYVRKTRVDGFRASPHPSLAEDCRARPSRSSVGDSQLQPPSHPDPIVRTRARDLGFESRVSGWLYNNGTLRADEDETRWVCSSIGMQRRGEREIPEKTRRPAPSSGTIPTCESSGANPPGILSGSLWWDTNVE